MSYGVKFFGPSGIPTMIESSYGWPSIIDITVNIQEFSSRDINGYSASQVTYFVSPSIYNDHFQVVDITGGCRLEKTSSINDIARIVMVIKDRDSDAAVTSYGFSADGVHGALQISAEVGTWQHAGTVSVTHYPWPSQAPEYSFLLLEDNVINNYEARIPTTEHDELQPLVMLKLPDYPNGACIAGYWNTVTRGGLFKQQASNGSWYWSVPIVATTTPEVHLFWPTSRNTNPPTGTHGMRIFDSSGNEVFDSRKGAPVGLKIPLRPVSPPSDYQIPYSYTEGRSVTVSDVTVEQNALTLGEGWVYWGTLAGDKGQYQVTSITARLWCRDSETEKPMHFLKRMKTWITEGNRPSELASTQRMSSFNARVN